MASSYESFKELNLNRDEVERLTDALKDKKFRDLLVEYVEEVKKPESVKLYQDEITQLEKERGIDVTFINPVAGYVIKTSVNGNQKAFINVCANENINKPTSNPTVQEGTRGLRWSLPHSLAPPREDVDNKGARCQVYDVVFHPDTLHLAQKNKAFRDMVNKTASEAVEKSFDLALDKKNLKFPKLQYKGFARAAVVRKPSKEQPPELSPEDQATMDQFYAKLGDYPPQQEQPRSPKKIQKSPKKNKIADEHSAYTVPKYVIKHSRGIEMVEFTEHKHAKINTAIPKELVVEVNLPLLKASTDIVLDVTEKTLQLHSEKPAKYKLALTLPYRVSHEIGNAKFDKDRKFLVVTLPVKMRTGMLLSDIGRDDSGVDSDHGSTSSSPVDEFNHNSIIAGLAAVDNSVNNNDLVSEVKMEEQFLNLNLHYSLPEFTAHLVESTIAFTLHVKNVDETSVTQQISQSGTDFHMKFCTISSGFYPLHYAFYLKFLNHNIDSDKLSIETWDNNIIVQIALLPRDEKLISYLFGLNKHDLTEKFVDEPSVINAALQSQLEERKTGAIKKEEKHKNKKDRKKGRRANSADDGKTENSQSQLTISSSAIDILRSYSESSGDEVSCSYSPTKGRGILKGLSNSRRFGRSISESGLDEVSWTSSTENFHTSVDSVIPEEGEVSTSLKKTVRFNDVVSRQLFR